MKLNELPERWQARLTQHLRTLRPTGRHELGAQDFPSDQMVRIGFPDGSSALFRFAFFLADPKAAEVAVFTEHCGYHIFPVPDATVELLRVANVLGE